MVGNSFPCDGFVVAWDYYNTLAGSAYIGVFRQVDVSEFFLVGYSRLPYQGVGPHSYTLPQPVLVQTGDFIGVFYDQNAQGGIIASTREEDNQVPAAELFRSIYISAFAENFLDGSPFIINNFANSERQMTMAVQADMSYENVPGMYKCCKIARQLKIINLIYWEIKLLIHHMEKKGIIFLLIQGWVDR